MKTSLLALSIVLVSSFAPTHALGFEPAGAVDARYVVKLEKGRLFNIAICPGGKLLVAGLHEGINGVACEPFVRLTAEGTIDPSFKAEGVRYVLGMAVLPGGKIAVACHNGGREKSNPVIVRLNADGTLDASFPEVPAPEGQISCMGLQQDGKMLLAGKFTTVAAATRMNIARFNADGSLEAQFNARTNGQVNAVAVQPDGKIVIGGQFTSVNGEERNYVARLAPDGSLEPPAAFNTGKGPNKEVKAIALQPDGKILIAGRFTAINGERRHQIARLHANGAVEDSLSFSPPVSPLPLTGNQTVYEDLIGATVSLALQADGKILVGLLHAVKMPAKTTSLLTRLGSNGVRENTDRFAPRFGADTKAAFKDCGLFEEFYAPAVALQADGKIIVGPENAFGNHARTVFDHVLRLTNDPALEILIASNASNAYWMRTGSAPEVSFVTFEVSTDAGVTWAPLGFGTRIRGGWQCAGLSLPPSGLLRARGSVPGSFRNGAQGLVEKIAPFKLTVPVRKP